MRLVLRVSAPNSNAYLAKNFNVHKDITCRATIFSNIISFQLHSLRRRMPLEDNANLAYASKSLSQTQRAAVSPYPCETVTRRMSNRRTVYTTRPRVEPRGYRKQPCPCHERFLAVSRRISTRSPCQGRESMETGWTCWYVLSLEIHISETLLVP